MKTCWNCNGTKTIVIKGSIQISGKAPCPVCNNPIKEEVINGN